MSCSDTTDNCNPCCNPAPTCDATNEPLSSQVANLVEFLLGTVTKTCDADGNVIWSIGCDLQGNAPIPGYVNTASGFLCYLVETLTTITEDFTIRQSDGFIEVPTNKSYTVMAAAKVPFTINNLTIKTSGGTCTVAVAINGVNVTGLGALAVTSTVQTVNATALNTVALANKITFTVSANAAAANLEFSMQYTQT